MLKIGGLQFLEDAIARSLADARAAPLVRGMAGMTRFLHELVAGESVVEGEAPVVGANPQNLIGVDLSGPPWGPALRHPIGGWAGFAGDVDVIEPDPIFVVTNNSGLAVFRRTGPFPIWVRPFEAIPFVDVPYSRGYLSIRAHKTGSNTDLVVRARNVTLGESFARPDGTTTLSVTSTSETTFAPTDTWLNLTPGLNFVDLEFFSATSGAGVVVDSVVVYQAVKLQH